MVCSWYAWRRSAAPCEEVVRLISRGAQPTAVERCYIKVLRTPERCCTDANILNTTFRLNVPQILFDKRSSRKLLLLLLLCCCSHVVEGKQHHRRPPTCRRYCNTLDVSRVSHLLKTGPVVPHGGVLTTMGMSPARAAAAVCSRLILINRRCCTLKAYPRLRRFPTENYPAIPHVRG